MQHDLCHAAKALIQRVMETYLSGNPEAIAGLFKSLAPDVLVVGTGKHEFYRGLESLGEGMKRDQEEAAGIRFLIRDIWFEAKRVTEDSCIVYGELRAQEDNAEGKLLVIDMDTRITASVHREADGRLVIDSLHQSIPYIYQQEGEYYPKTFADQAEEALKRSMILERSIQLDALTGLYNRRYTEQHITRLLTEGHETGLFFAIDLDDFKKVNDTFGHLAGDDLLKRAAVVFLSNVPANAIVGRVGGDEFIIFLPGVNGRRDGEATALELVRGVGAVYTKMRLELSCSVGITHVAQRGDSFHSAYKRADKALYHAKTQGKNGFFWYEEIDAQESWENRQAFLRVNPAGRRERLRPTKGRESDADSE